MRVYIPDTLAAVAGHLDGVWEPTHAFAVTDSLRDAAPDLDDDELAELAIDFAAEHSAYALGSRLRVVVAADYSRADVAFHPQGGPAAVRLTGRLAPSAVACLFVDEADAAQDVLAAQAGDEEAQDRLGERHLLWFDPSEASYLDAPA